MLTSHQLQLAVRDYECDLQGVVNNAVYQHYLEHARHELLKVWQIDFAQLTESGVMLVVVRAELDYLGSLKSGDSFTVCTYLERLSRLRFAFHQSIVKFGDNKRILDAIIIATGVNKLGKPYLPQQLLPLLAAYETETTKNKITDRKNL